MAPPTQIASAWKLTDIESPRNIVMTLGASGGIRVIVDAWRRKPLAGATREGDAHHLPSAAQKSPRSPRLIAKNKNNW